MKSEENLSKTQLASLMNDIGDKAYKAGKIIKQAACEQKNNALLTAANTIRLSAKKILEANSLDMKLASQKGLKKS